MVCSGNRRREELGPKTAVVSEGDVGRPGKESPMGKVARSGRWDSDPAEAEGIFS